MEIEEEGGIAEQPLSFVQEKVLKELLLKVLIARGLGDCACAMWDKGLIGGHFKRTEIQ